MTHGSEEKSQSGTLDSRYRTQGDPRRPRQEGVELRRGGVIGYSTFRGEGVRSSGRIFYRTVNDEKPLPLG